MTQIYKAVLHGDRIEWINPPPDNRESAAISITLEENISESGSHGQEMADALNDLARDGGLSSIPDPLEWQREIRKDRPASKREL